MVTFVKTKSGLQVYNKKGEVFSVSADHPFFTAINALVLDTEKTFEDFFELYEAKKADKILKLALGKNLEIREEDGELTVTYKGMDLPVNLQHRLVLAMGRIYSETGGFLSFSEIISSTGDIPEEMNPLINFVENLMANPSRGSVSDLYGFLEDCSLPITSDGCFLAYKKVRYDYKDIYSGKNDNSVGEELSMERWEVNDDRNQTCSTGYHCCSFDYLAHYGDSRKDSHRIIVVKVNPKDVVSVPTDYSNQKMRVCSYTVVDEIPAASSGRLAEWYVPPVMEGKAMELVEAMIAALKTVGEKFKLDYLVEAAEKGINFDDCVVLTIPAENDFFEEVIKALEKFDANTENIDFDEYLEEHGSIDINSLVLYINERVY